MPRGVNMYDEARIQGRNVANANSVNVVSPGIVTDGLVLHLDAGNFNSYPIAGTIWYDLSGNGNNYGLTNNITYTLTGNGSMSFNGTNSYCSITDNSSLKPAALSLGIWAKKSTTSQAQCAVLLKRYSIDQAPYNSYGIVIDPSVTYYSCLIGTGTSLYNATTNSVNDTNWHNIFLTFNGSSVVSYLDGVVNNTTSVSGAVAYSTLIATMGGGPSNWGGVNAFAGNLTGAMLYNRALTPTEVSQNFNATRARFGI